MNCGALLGYRLPDAEIERFLQEDLPYGDLTTALLAIGDRPGVTDAF